MVGVSKGKRQSGGEDECAWSDSGLAEDFRIKEVEECVLDAVTVRSAWWHLLAMGGEIKKESEHSNLQQVAEFFSRHPAAGGFRWFI